MMFFCFNMNVHELTMNVHEYFLFNMIVRE